MTNEPRYEKTSRSSGFQTRSHTNQAVKPQKMARGLKFRIKKVEGLYYLCSENKGADQLCRHHEADLRLCFHICKKPVFSRRSSNKIVTENRDTKQQLESKPVNTHFMHSCKAFYMLAFQFKDSFMKLVEIVQSGPYSSFECFLCS